LRVQEQRKQQSVEGDVHEGRRELKAQEQFQEQEQVVERQAQKGGEQEQG
jgi:hypothetical protein